MKALLALGAATALSGCAYYDPYVYNTPYYATAPGYYGSVPYTTAPYYYYDGTVVPYGGYSYGYAYPDVYPGYVYPRVIPGPRRHLRDRPGADGHGRFNSGPGHQPSQPGRGSSGARGGGGSGAVLPGQRPDNPPAGGGSGAMLPGQSPDASPSGGGSGAVLPGRAR